MKHSQAALAVVRLNNYRHNQSRLSTGHGIVVVVYEKITAPFYKAVTVI